MKYALRHIFINRLALAIAFPIVVLLCLMLYKQHIVSTGQIVKLAIVGFDPRDLLAGHYLRYRIDYQINTSCNSTVQNNKKMQLCLKPQPYFIAPNNVLISECQLYLSGRCKEGKFVAGIERFYIPEQYANQLDTLVRNTRGELQVSINKQGQAQIQNLLIDGQPWQERLQ